ncbi:uncharacterized protein LOC143915629 [Arctopsyche grandis]|uniref:uncharacterized protein LOC143915629 n=1 Tax=Arctopsyche grandis TaxID=121162 RepID=UPI00406D9D7B
MSSDETSDSGLDEGEYENLGGKLRRPQINKIIQQNREFRKHAKKPTSIVQAPIKTLSEALKILNTPIPKFQNTCVAKRWVNSRTAFKHKTVSYYATFIKRAILRQDWASVPKLLIAYINLPKTDRQHSVAILKYTFVFLLNDPVAKENAFLLEFFNTLLFTKTKTEQLDFIKKLMTIPDLDLKYLQGQKIFDKK